MLIVLILLFVNDWTLTPALFAIISFLFLNSAFSASFASLAIPSSSSDILSNSFRSTTRPLCFSDTPFPFAFISNVSATSFAPSAISFVEPFSPFSPDARSNSRNASCIDFCPITVVVSFFFFCCCCCFSMLSCINRAACIYATSISNTRNVPILSRNRSSSIVCVRSSNWKRGEKRNHGNHQSGTIKRVGQSAEARDFCR